MHKVTRKSLKDSDINIDRVKTRLIEISDAIKNNNKNNLTDINVICEEIFGKILNIIYGTNLISLSAEVSGNFVAVDLIDYDKRIAYQVTSRNDRKKINDTINKFNKSDLITKIDTLNFLILDTDEHNYKGNDTILLVNDNKFSYKNNIMNFNGLIEQIIEYNANKENILVNIYDTISMVFDSGRLRYYSIVKNTEELGKEYIYELEYYRLWKKGYGDIQLTAFIPLSYDKELSCLLEMRQHNLSGAYMTFDQDTLINDYFLEEDEFENKHYVGRYEDEDELCIQIENIKMNINAHAAYHIYKLFSELKEEYYKALREIDEILGAYDFKRVGKKYLLTTIDLIEWEEILSFARSHDWQKDDREIEWNIFNNNLNAKKIILSPNVHGDVKGDIFAEISVEYSEQCGNQLDVFWEPGWYHGMRYMEGFDNNIKWKCDYTKDWFQKQLLSKAHDFCEKQYKKRSFWNQLFK